MWLRQKIDMKIGCSSGRSGNGAGRGMGEGAGEAVTAIRQGSAGDGCVSHGSRELV